MAISDDLNSIRTHLEDDYTALEQLGVSVEDRNIENIKDMANQIYAKFPKTDYAEGSNITLSNTLKGKLDFENDIVGYGDTSQKSYEGYQLLNYTLGTLKALNTSGTWNNNVYTLNGLTFTVNEDLTITVNGTSTANTDFNIQNFSYTNGNEYTLVDELDDNAYGKYTMMIASFSQWGQNTLITDKYRTFTASTTAIISTRIVVYNGNTLSNKIFKPMLYSGAYNSTKTFEPYVGGTASPNPSYPQEIEVVRGKNRFNKDNFESYNGFVDITTKKVNYNASVKSIIIGCESNTTYTVQKLNGGNYDRFSISSFTSKPTVNSVATNVIGDNSAKSLTITSGTSDKYLMILYYNTNETTYTESQILDSIMLEPGSTATSYLPYNTIEVVERGKNWLPNNSTTQTVNGITYTINEDKSITISGTATARADIYLFGGSTDTGNYLHIPKGTYVLNDRNKLTNGSLFLAFREKTAGTKYETTTSDTAMELLANQDCYFYGVMLAVENGVTLNQMTFYPMVSNETTTYEPYQTPQTYQLSLGDKELYTDSEIVRVSKNNFKFVDKWKKISINSNDIENISKGCAIISHKYFIDIADIGTYDYTTIPPILSNIDKSEKWSYINDNDDLSGKMFLLKLTESQNQFRLYLNATTVQEAKTNLDNSNAYFIYKTNTPIETPITDTILINQLENFYNSHSFTGTTIIEIDGQLPLIIKVRALKGE